MLWDDLSDFGLAARDEETPEVLLGVSVRLRDVAGPKRNDLTSTGPWVVVVPLAMSAFPSGSGWTRIVSEVELDAIEDPDEALDVSVWLWIVSGPNRSDFAWIGPWDELFSVRD